MKPGVERSVTPGTITPSTPNPSCGGDGKLRHGQAVWAQGKTRLLSVAPFQGLVFFLRSNPEFRCALHSGLYSGAPSGRS